MRKETEKQTIFFYFEIIIFILFMYAISALVFLNGDDFMYGTFAKEGILKNSASYYITGNGRFWINVLDSLLLSCDRYLYIAINPIIVMLFIILLAKNMQLICFKQEDRQQERQFIRYGMVLFACLDVLCVRETVFWITGMMNYLFPATIFLLATLLFQMLHINSDVPLIKKIAYWILCLLAGSSVEQYALMFVGLMTIVIALDLFTRKKVSSCLIVGYVISLIGLSTLIFAPGNFVRVDAHQGIMPPFIDNLWTLVYQDTMASSAFPYFLMLSMCSSVIAISECKSKLIRIGSLLVTALTLAINCLPMLNKAILIAALLACVIVQLFCLFAIRKYAEKRMMVSLIVVGIGSQVMLLISAIWGYRCMFSMYMIYMMLIIYCLSILKPIDRGLVLCSGIVGSLCPAAVAIIWLLRALLRKKTTTLSFIFKPLIRVAVLASLTVLIVGYARNGPIHLENIENTKKASINEPLRMNELPDDTFSWYFIPMNEFHEEYYKKYHDIPNSIEIEYITD
ncbi:MAG: DUF6056 family protein [Eubacteriales bacterium]|nr:DUF6056 family protein [Eubacteriales bacterium]